LNDEEPGIDEDDLELLADNKMEMAGGEKPSKKLKRNDENEPKPPPVKQLKPEERAALATRIKKGERNKNILEEFGNQYAGEYQDQDDL
jgi:hypothetical protein